MTTDDPEHSAAIHLADALDHLQAACLALDEAGADAEAVRLGKATETVDTLLSHLTGVYGWGPAGLMNVDALLALADSWHDEAALLRRRGAARQAETLESAADDLEHRIKEWQAEPLTAEQAAAESGYSADHLRRLARDGELPTAGNGDGPVQVERQHLPRKPGLGLGSRRKGPIGSRSRVARTVLESN